MIKTFHCKQGGTAIFVLVCSGVFFCLFAIKKKKQEKEGKNEKS